jgi:hypothetical protein
LKNIVKTETNTNDNKRQYSEISIKDENLKQNSVSPANMRMSSNRITEMPYSNKFPETLKESEEDEYHESPKQKSNF